MKLLGIVLAGVFIGVIVSEIMRQTKPEAFEGVEKAACDFLGSFKSAFSEGYKKAA
jgi:hypothetical protein